MSTLKWVRDNGCEWDSYTCNYAVLNGQLETLKFGMASQEKTVVLGSYICKYAALNGLLSTLKWAEQNGCMCTDKYHKD